MNTFFKRRFDFEGGRTCDLKDIKKIEDLDREVKASGFSHNFDLENVKDLTHTDQSVKRDDEGMSDNARIEDPAEEDLGEEDLGEEDAEDYVLQDPKLVLEDEEDDVTELDLDKLHLEEGEEGEEKGKMNKRRGKRRLKMKEGKYIKNAIRSKFKKKGKVKYNRNRNKEKGKMKQLYGLK